MAIGTEHAVDTELIFEQQEYRMFADVNYWEVPHQFSSTESSKLYLSPLK